MLTKWQTMMMIMIVIMISAKIGKNPEIRFPQDKNKEDENVQDMVPSFAETYEALEKVKAFFYAHSVTDTDREHILGLEKSEKFCHEAKDNVQLFLIKKKWFSGFIVFTHASFVFSSPLKNDRSRVHCN
jgi:hypothetical protein